MSYQHPFNPAARDWYLFLEQLDNRNLETSRESLDCVERRIGLSAFNTAHIRAGEAAPVRKGFLRQSGCPSKGGNTIAKSLSERDAHTLKFGLMYTD
jgi:hypothetical protein